MAADPVPVFVSALCPFPTSDPIAAAHGAMTNNTVMSRAAALITRFFLLRILHSFTNTVFCFLYVNRSPVPEDRARLSREEPGQIY
jgi:hypothetical protein